MNLFQRIMKKLKETDKGTVIRSAALIVAIANQILAVVGASTFAGALWYQTASLAVTAIAAVIAAWENNDWTEVARLSTGVLNALADGKITADEVKALIGEKSET